jgi:hypothetical protein
MLKTDNFSLKFFKNASFLSFIAIMAILSSLLLFEQTKAWAGYYQATFTAVGSQEFAGGRTIPGNSDFSQNYAHMGGDALSCTGEYTVQFDWQPANSNDPAPTTVYAILTGKAKSNYSVTSSGGQQTTTQSSPNADDGIGDPAVWTVSTYENTTMYSGSSTGSHGRTIGGQSFTMSFSPAGSSVEIAVQVELPTIIQNYWTPDYTTDAPNSTSPVEILASDGDTIGGVTRLQLTLPPGGLAAISELRIHEDAAPDASQDVVYTRILSYQPISQHLKNYYIQWPRNGSYTITAPCTYQLGGDPPIQYTSTAHIKIEDLLITETKPANPTPILLKYADGASVPDPAPISATFQAVYKDFLTGTVQIYSTDQTLVRTFQIYNSSSSNPVYTTDGTLSFTWDGRTDPTTDSNGNPVPGAYQNAGVYLFKFNLGTLHASDGDCDKSGTLAFGNPATSITLSDDTDYSDGQMETLGYSLSDSTGNAPIAAQLDIFQNWDDKDVFTAKMTPLLGVNSYYFKDPDSSDQPTLDQYIAGAQKIYLVSPQDGDALSDKGHRNRYALQHNNAGGRYFVLSVGCYYPGDIDSDSAYIRNNNQTIPQARRAVNLAQLLHNPWWGYLFMGFGSWDPAAPDWNNCMPSQIIQDSFTMTNVANGFVAPNGLIAHCVDIAYLCVHGDSGNTVGFGLVDSDRSLDYSGTGRWLLTTGGSTFSNAVPFDMTRCWGNTRLVVWSGCETCSNFSGAGFPAASVAKGAWCSIGFQGPQNIEALTECLDEFNHKASARGSDKYTVYKALKAAANHHITPIGGDWKDHCGISGRSSLWLPRL